MFTVFDKLGGLSEALNIIEAATAKRPTDSAVRSWRDGRRIPGKDAFILQKEMEARGIPYTTEDFESDKPKRSREQADEREAAE